MWNEKKSANICTLNTFNWTQNFQNKLLVLKSYWIQSSLNDEIVRNRVNQIVFHMFEPLKWSFRREDRRKKNRKLWCSIFNNWYLGIWKINISFLSLSNTHILYRFDLNSFSGRCKIMLMLRVFELRRTFIFCQLFVEWVTEWVSFLMIRFVHQLHALAIHFFSFS